MKPGGGKAKGAEYERLVCKRLSLWMSRGLRTDLFWRSAMSGGRATVAHKLGRSVSQGGDITAVDTRGAPLTDAMLIECKHYGQIDLRGLLPSGPKDGIAAWWWQCQRDAVRQSKLPLLFARCRTAEYVVTNVDGFVFLNVAEPIAIFPARRAYLMYVSQFLNSARRPR